MAEIHEELTGLRGLKEEVHEIQKELVALPRMDTKLSQMESSLHSMLQQILKQTAPEQNAVTDPSSSTTQQQQKSSAQRMASGQEPPLLSATNLQAAFQSVSSTAFDQTATIPVSASNTQAILTESTTYRTVQNFPTNPSHHSPTHTASQTTLLHATYHTSSTNVHWKLWSLQPINSSTIHISKHL